MLQIGKTLVSTEILEKEFVCNLSKCKGACCVEGDAGAPLEKSEIVELENALPKVIPYLRQESVDSIKKQGAYVFNESENDYETPLLNGKECSYTVFDDNGTAKCGIEKAYLNGDISFKKPISCHLYPIRLQEYRDFTAVNYEKWTICEDACALGQELKVNVFSFLKEPLIRKFGEDWYNELNEVSKAL